MPEWGTEPGKRYSEPSPRGDPAMLRIEGQQAVTPGPLSAARVTGTWQQLWDRVLASADQLGQKGLIAALNALAYCRGKKRAVCTSGMGRCLSEFIFYVLWQHSLMLKWQSLKGSSLHTSQQQHTARAECYDVKNNPGKSCPGTAQESLASSI